MRCTLALAALALLVPCARAADPIYPDQGWTADDRQTFYRLPQGSELMPYSWFLALEQPWNDKLFRDAANIEAFRYIPEPKGEHNPDGLPVGFVKGRGADGRYWFGFTCAACHTSELTFRGQTVRVDGGTTLADALGFQSALVAALKATLAEPAKFDRFARRVLGAKPTLEQAKALTATVREQVREMADWEARSRPAHPGGHGVWDALGILMNTITGTAPGIPDNYRVPSTPASYPSIWYTNKYDRLLWNASVESVTLRQVGEVIIVFGRAKAVVGPDGKFVFGSSADLKGLDKIYEYTSSLKPPPWPEGAFGKIDRDRAKQGEAIYRRERCAECHTLNPDPKKTITVTATPIAEVGTDPDYATYFVTRTAVPDKLAPLFRGTMFERQKQLPAAIQFLATLTAITSADIDRVAKTPQEREDFLNGRPLPTLPDTQKKLDKLVKDLLVYKATPLSGIWATAPYLHNGSVASLYELLLPAEKRMKSFHLGDREFDPKHVGYRTGPSEGSYQYDTTLPGFSNRGHEYGTKLSDAERWALVEFLKSL